MNVEQLRDYCLSLPLATEDFPFDEEVLAFRICGKIFAMINLADTSWFVLKCQPDCAIALRDAYAEIAPAWHMNKKYWNQVNLFGSLGDAFLQDLVRHSYEQVVAKFPRKKKEQLPELLGITSSLTPDSCSLKSFHEKF